MNVEFADLSVTGKDGLFSLQASSTGVDAIRLHDGDDKTLPYVTRSNVGNGIASFIAEEENSDYGCDVEWERFRIGQLFTVKRPSARNKDDYLDGSIPFVASGATNNGVMKCCTPKQGERLDAAGCITVSPVDGSSFYQPAAFLGRGGAGSSVLMLYSDAINEWSGLFMARLIRQTCSKYTYGHMGNKDSIKREVIQLPVTDDGKPDWDYMSSSSKDKREVLLARYIQYAEERVSRLKHVDIPGLDEVKWAPVRVSALFDEIVPGKGKGLNHLPKSPTGTIPYIGATNRNNGVMCFIDDSADAANMILPGNCIGFIKNGDGSAGYAIYKRERFISTSDVIYGYSENLNEFVGLFIATAQDMIKRKYSHGYKRNEQRLVRDRIMLPVIEDDKPDWSYMEQYAKNMMLRKYQQYLDYLDCACEPE